MEGPRNSREVVVVMRHGVRRDSVEGAPAEPNPPLLPQRGPSEVEGCVASELAPAIRDAIVTSLRQPDEERKLRVQLRVVCSPFTRTLETARIIAARLPRQLHDAFTRYNRRAPVARPQMPPLNIDMTAPSAVAATDNGLCEIFGPSHVKAVTLDPDEASPPAMVSLAALQADLDRNCAAVDGESSPAEELRRDRPRWGESPDDAYVRMRNTVLQYFSQTGAGDDDENLHQGEEAAVMVYVTVLVTHGDAVRAVSDHVSDGRDILYSCNELGFVPLVRDDGGPVRRADVLAQGVNWMRVDEADDNAADHEFTAAHLRRTPFAHVIRVMDAEQSQRASVVSSEPSAADSHDASANVSVVAPSGTPEKPASLAKGREPAPGADESEGSDSDDDDSVDFVSDREVTPERSGRHAHPNNGSGDTAADDTTRLPPRAVSFDSAPEGPANADSAVRRTDSAGGASDARPSVDGGRASTAIDSERFGSCRSTPAAGSSGLNTAEPSPHNDAPSSGHSSPTSSKTQRLGASDDQSDDVRQVLQSGSKDEPLSAPDDADASAAAHATSMAPPASTPEHRPSWQPEEPFASLPRSERRVSGVHDDDDGGEDAPRSTSAAVADDNRTEETDAPGSAPSSPAGSERRRGSSSRPHAADDDVDSPQRRGSSARESTHDPQPGAPAELPPPGGSPRTGTVRQQNRRTRTHRAHSDLMTNEQKDALFLRLHNTMTTSRASYLSRASSSVNFRSTSEMSDARQSSVGRGGSLPRQASSSPRSHTPRQRTPRTTTTPRAATTETVPTTTAGTDARRPRSTTPRSRTPRTASSSHKRRPTSQTPRPANTSQESESQQQHTSRGRSPGGAAPSPHTGTSGRDSSSERPPWRAGRGYGGGCAWETPPRSVSPASRRRTPSPATNRSASTSESRGEQVFTSLYVQAVSQRKKREEAAEKRTEQLTEQAIKATKPSPRAGVSLYRAQSPAEKNDAMKSLINALRADPSQDDAAPAQPKYRRRIPMEELQRQVQRLSMPPKPMKASSPTREAAALSKCTFKPKLSEKTERETARRTPRSPSPQRLYQPRDDAVEKQQRRVEDHLRREASRQFREHVTANYTFQRRVDAEGRSNSKQRYIDATVKHMRQQMHEAEHTTRMCLRRDVVLGPAGAQRSQMSGVGRARSSSATSTRGQSPGQRRDPSGTSSRSDSRTRTTSTTRTGHGVLLRSSRSRNDTSPGRPSFERTA